MSEFTRVLNRSLQADKSDVVLSVDRSVIEALVRDDLVDLVDTHGVPVAEAPQAVLAQVQVVVAESHVFTEKN